MIVLCFNFSATKFFMRNFAISSLIPAKTKKIIAINCVVSYPRRQQKQIPTTLPRKISVNGQKYAINNHLLILFNQSVAYIVIVSYKSYILYMIIVILFMLIFVYYKCCIWSNTYAQCVVIRHTCNLFSVVFQTVAHVTCNYVWRYSTCPHTGEYTCQHNKACYVKLILIDDNSVLLVLYWIILKKN